MAFSRIFWRNPYGIKIESIRVGFCKPKNCFITSRESFASVQSVIESPYNAITKFQFMLFKNIVINNIEGKNFWIINKIANLPADASIIPQYSNKLINYSFLEFQVRFYTPLIFVTFTKIVRWGSNYKLCNLVRKCFYKLEWSPQCNTMLCSAMNWSAIFGLLNKGNVALVIVL